MLSIQLVWIDYMAYMHIQMTLKVSLANYNADVTWTIRLHVKSDLYFLVIVKNIEVNFGMEIWSGVLLCLL